VVTAASSLALRSKAADGHEGGGAVRASCLDCVRVRLRGGRRFWPPEPDDVRGGSFFVGVLASARVEGGRVCAVRWWRNTSVLFAAAS
jgi:hypothetical protein